MREKSRGNARKVDTNNTKRQTGARGRDDANANADGKDGIEMRAVTRRGEETRAGKCVGEATYRTKRGGIARDEEAGSERRVGLREGEDVGEEREGEEEEEERKGFRRRIVIGERGE